MSGQPPAQPPEQPEPSEDPPRDPLAFTPVPRLQMRHDGWGPDVQRTFIECLADTVSVKEAARRVGLSASSAYRLRRHPEGAEFAAAWAAARAHAIEQIEDFALDRAANGVEVPVFAYGDKVATRRVFSEPLVMFMLKNLAPERYCSEGARGLSALDKRKLERLKKEWREEWEEERRARETKDEAETLESLDAFFEGLRRNRLTNLSPAERERQIAAAAQARADRAAGWQVGEAYRPYAERAAELLPQFITEVEAEWPPLPPWAWDDPDDEEHEPACQLIDHLHSEDFLPDGTVDPEALARARRRRAGEPDEG